MKKSIPLFIFLQCTLINHAISQKIKYNDLLGKWKVLSLSDTTMFDFLDTCVIIKTIYHSKSSDQTSRTEVSHNTKYHIVEFNNETLLIFDSNPSRFLYSTFLIRKVDQDQFKIQAIQYSILNDYRVSWNKKTDSRVMILLRVI